MPNSILRRPWFLCLQQVLQEIGLRWLLMSYRLDRCLVEIDCVVSFCFFQFLLGLPSRPMDYVKVCCLIPTCLEILFVFLLSISPLIPLWSENTLRRISISLLADVCRMVQDIIRASECLMGTWKRLSILLSDAVFYKCEREPLGALCLSDFPPPRWLRVW